MKHRLQTLLRHKLQWLVLLTALLGVSQGVWGWRFPGDFNGWDTSSSWGSGGYGVCLAGGDAVYEFKLENSGTWYSNSGAGTMTSSDCSNWTMYSSDQNKTKIKSEHQGLYIFKVVDEVTPKISVLYNVVGSNYFKLKFKGANATEVTGNNNKKATVDLGVLTISSSNKLTVDYWNCYWYKQGDGNICNGNGGLRWKLDNGDWTNNDMANYGWDSNKSNCAMGDGISQCNDMNNDGGDFDICSSDTPGNHTFEFYFEGTACSYGDYTVYNSNQGQNYKVTFTVPGYSSATGTNYAFSNTVVGSSSSSGSLGTSTHYGDTSGASIGSTNTTDFTATKTDADTYSVTFNPKSTGSKSTTITITDKYGKTYQRTFTGTGTAIGNPSNATLSFSGSTATIGWRRNSSDYNKVIVVRYEGTSITPALPVNGTSYNVDGTISEGGKVTGTVIYNANCELNSTTTTNTITPGKSYTYYMFTNNNNCYSTGIYVSGCSSPISGFAAVGQFNKDQGSPWVGSASTASTAATGGYFADDHRTATLSTTQDANVFQWYGCDADGSNLTTTPANVTLSSSSTNTCTATFELPGTYYFLCKAGCSSADVASRVVQIDVPYPEMGISGPFFDGDWHHSKAGTDGLFSRKGLTWSKTFDCNTSDGKFVIIQRYKKGHTSGDPAGWLGDSPDNKINGGTFTSLTGVERLSGSNYDFKSTIPCLASGNEVTFTVTMIAHDTYTVSLTKTKTAPTNLYLKGIVYDGSWTDTWHAFSHTSGSNLFTLSFNAKKTDSDNGEFLISTVENGNGKINSCMDATRIGWSYKDDSDHSSNFVVSDLTANKDIVITVIYNPASDEYSMIINKPCSTLATAHSSSALYLDEYTANVICPGEKAKATMVSRKGYTYELFNGVTSYGSNAGNGTTLSWKNLSDAGTYYVMATKSDDATCTGIVGTASQTINSSTVSVTASPGTSVVDFRPITLSKSASSTVDGDLTWAITAGSNGYLLLLSSKLPYDDRQRESVIFKGGPYGDTPSRAYTVTATGKKTVNIGDTDDKKTCESTATVNITLTAVPGCN